MQDGIVIASGVCGTNRLRRIWLDAGRLERRQEQLFFSLADSWRVKIVDELLSDKSITADGFPGRGYRGLGSVKQLEMRDGMAICYFQSWQAVLVLAAGRTKKEEQKASTPRESGQGQRPPSPSTITTPLLLLLLRPVNTFAFRLCSSCYYR